MKKTLLFLAAFCMAIAACITGTVYHGDGDFDTFYHVQCITGTEILIRFITFNINEGEISSMKKGDLFNSIGVFSESLGYDAHGNITSVGTEEGHAKELDYNTYCRAISHYRINNMLTLIKSMK